MAEPLAVPSGVNARYRQHGAKSAPCTMPIQKGPKPEDLPMPLRYWNPDRFRVPVWASESRVNAFQDKLRGVDDRLALSFDYDRFQESGDGWAVYTQDPKVKWKWSPGWRLLFYVKRLDDRIIDRLKMVDSTEYGGSMNYFRWWEQKAADRRRKRHQEDRQELRDMASERWRYSLPKVSMCGHSNGSKFANHQSGD